MAYKILKCSGVGYIEDDDGYYHEYICDTLTDKNSLPTGSNMAKSMAKPRPGSTAIVSADRSVWHLTCQRNWALLVEGDD